MSYTLYTDKNEDFICDVAVKNASLKNSIARIIVESDNATSMVFNGKITGGKCIVPIKRLKGLLEEHVTGRMHLEIIVEDTYFKPWESNFIVEEHTSVKVNLHEQKSYKQIPSVEVKHIKNNLQTPINEVAFVFKRFKINSKTIKNRKKDVIQIIKEYIKYNPEYKLNQRDILLGVKSII